MHRLVKPFVLRPKATIVIWLIVMVALAANAPQAGQRVTQSTLELPGTPSTHAMELYRQRFGDSVSVPILLQGPPAQLDKQGPRLVRGLMATPRVRVLSPWDRAAGPSALRHSPQAALVLAVLDQPESQTIQAGAPQIQRAVARTIAAPVHAHVTGTAVIGHAIKNASFSASDRAERLAFPILLLVLLLVFRSPVAAAIPLTLGFMTVGAGTGVIALLARAMPIDTVAVSLGSMMGLALGVDYSLLIVSRFREELAHADGVDVRTAAALTAAEAAGRTVVFAGVALLTGMIVALLLAPGALLTSAAIGVILAALLSVVGALTVVPAALALLGPNVNRWALGRRGASARRRPRWLALPARAMRRPGLSAGMIFAALLVLAIPALAIKAGPPDVHQLPPNDPARKDFDAVQRTMGPGWVAPYEIVSVSRKGTIANRARLAVLSRVQDRIARDPGVLTVVGPGTVADQTARPVAGAAHEYASAGGQLRRGRQQTNQLIGGLGQAAGGVGQLRSGLAQAATGLQRLGSGSQGAQQGAEQLANGLSAAAAGSSQLDQGLTGAAAGAGQLADASGAAAAGAQRLAATLEQIRSGVRQGVPGAGGQGLAGVSQPAQSARAELQNAASALAGMPPVAQNSPGYQQAVQSVQSALANTASVNQAIEAAGGSQAQSAQSAQQLAGQITNVLDQVTGGAEVLSAGAQRLHSNAVSLSDGIQQLAAGQGRLQAGLERLSASANSLAAGVAQLGNGAQAIESGVASGYASSAPLEQGLAQMQGGVVRFRDGSLDPAARRYRQAYAQTPHLFDSGYFVLAAIQGARTAKRRDANFVVNVANGGSAARILVVPRVYANTSASDRLAGRLSADARRIGAQADTAAQVGGPAQQLTDYARVTSSDLGLLVLALAGVTYLVLIPIFRSLVLPAIAVVLNLLTVGSAFGVLSLLFQGRAPLGGPGWLDAISVTAMYTVIFGLSMDYQVFLVTRMREGYLRTHDTGAAISHGIGRTASLVTGAAAIMLGVFVAFSLTQVINIRQFGIGLAVAVLLDATLVRLVLLPALIRLCGRHSWWLPRRLDRLIPEVSV